MARERRILGAVIEELIGLSTMLIPEPKHEPARMSMEGMDVDASIENIQTMRGLLGELRENEAFTSCPSCMDHLNRIAEELNWAEERVPSYERVVRLRRQLRELHELVKPEEEAPTEVAPPELEPEAPPTPTIPKEETASWCLECALNATLDAKRYLKEAQAADNKPRYIKRLLGMKEELQHAQDHLSDKFPELATRIRSLRKSIDPIILKGDMVKPLPVSVADLERVQDEVLSLAQKEYA